MITWKNFLLATTLIVVHLLVLQTSYSEIAQKETPKIYKNLKQMINKVVLVVNGIPVTQYDLENRMRLLRLQGYDKPDLIEAAQRSMIDEMVQKTEITKKDIKISNDLLTKAFSDMAQKNRMTAAEFKETIEKSGVNFQHFIDAIYTQIGWQMLLEAYIQEKERISPEAASAKIKSEGVAQPKQIQYQLKKIVFFIPQEKRSILSQQRQNELNQLRQNFKNCNDLKKQTDLFSDVIVTDLGIRFIDDLPDPVKPLIQNTKPGQISTTIDTNDGPAAIAVCQASLVSNDTITSFVYSMKNLSQVDKNKFIQFGDEYLNKVKKEATIQHV